MKMPHPLPVEIPARFERKRWQNLTFSHSSRCTFMTLEANTRRSLNLFPLPSTSFPTHLTSPDTLPGTLLFQGSGFLCFGPSRESSGITCLVRRFHPCQFFSLLLPARTFPNFLGLSAFAYNKTHPHLQQSGNRLTPSISSIVSWNLHSTDTVLLVLESSLQHLFPRILRRHHLPPP
jgi:hypothetical protein